MEHISRQSALKVGLKRFFTGVPCRHGHIAEQLVCNCKCMECDRQYRQARRRANPEKARADSRAQRRKNIEAERARSVKYMRDHPETRRANAAARRARKRAAGGHHTARDIVDIRKLQRGKCAYCRVSLKRTEHTDHHVPLYRGGSNARRNMQLLCAPCNLKKNRKDPIEFAREIGFLL